jgi:MFS family permease
MPPAQSYLGLSPNLWRLAIVTGVAQFSISIWSWQFTIFLEEILQPWQIGLNVTIGLLVGILGYPVSGIVSDTIGRRRTMIVSFLPMSLGLFLLYLYPIWPFITLWYGILQFGWSFVLIISRAVPADEIAADGGADSARRFTMVLLPALLVDGLSPVLAGILLTANIDARTLLLLGGIGSTVALFATAGGLRESLSTEVQTRAREGRTVPIRELGVDFWRLVGGMLAFSFTWNMAFYYLGNLCVGEWGIDPTTYGYTYSAFSLTSVLVMYSVSSLADRRRRGALLSAIAANTSIIWLLAIGRGLNLLLVINVGWAFPVMLWIGAERALIVQGVKDEHKGRALGTYQIIMSSTGILAGNVGAWIWTVTDSLRVLFMIAGILGFLSLVPLTIALRSVTVSQRED